MNVRLALAIAVVGFGTAIAVVATGDYMGNDANELLGMAFAGAAVTGVVGLGVLSGMRRSSLRNQAVAVALIGIAGSAVGISMSANAMFVSSHDLEALVVVLLTSGTTAALLAILLGARIRTASRDLEELIGRLGDGDLLTVGDVPVAHELRQLATRLEESSARLEEARRRERQMEASRRELVAWVSHDLRTPLAGIRAMVEALEDGVVDDPATIARYHATMRRQTDELAGLVDDLFELSRIHAGALDLDFAPVSLAELVDDAVASASPTAAAKGVDLRVVFDERPAPTVELSTREMTRVLRNLVDNAIRHTPAGGEIVIEAGHADDGAYLSVVDSGGGIPDDEIDRVFDLAFRGDAARSPGGDSGGGLGLAIARGFVEAHAGEIGVVNDNGGARFTVKLPTR